MIIADEERSRLLRLSGVKLEQVRYLFRLKKWFLSLEISERVLKKCNEEGLVNINGRLTLVSLVYEATIKPFNQHTLSYEESLELGRPRYLFETTKRLCETQKGYVDCQKNQRLFGVGRVGLEKSVIKNVTSITGDAAQEKLDMCLPSGDFFYDGKWLGKINEVEYVPARGLANGAEVISFSDYLKLGRPRFLVETKNVSYEPMVVDNVPLVIG